MCGTKIRDLCSSLQEVSPFLGTNFHSFWDMLTHNPGSCVILRMNSALAVMRPQFDRPMLQGHRNALRYPGEPKTRNFIRIQNLFQ